MSKYLKINEDMIIREEDKMIFSAKQMKIFRFNEKGFIVINTILNNKDIDEEKLLSLLEKDFTKEEINKIVNKMLDNNILVYEE